MFSYQGAIISYTSTTHANRVLNRYRLAVSRTGSLDARSWWTASQSPSVAKKRRGTKLNIVPPCWVRTTWSRVIVTRVKALQECRALALNVSVNNPSSENVQLTE